MKGYITNIEQETLSNTYFRKVLYTTKQSQLVIMCIEGREEIGEEVHKEHDQFIRVEAGVATVIMNGESQKVGDGYAIIIPAGVRHNIINAGKEKLKLYTLYCPPEHKDQTIHETKQNALESKEHFDGTTTEKA